MQNILKAELLLKGYSMGWSDLGQHFLIFKLFLNTSVGPFLRVRCKLLRIKYLAPVRKGGENQ